MRGHAKWRVVGLHTAPRDRAALRAPSSHTGRFSHMRKNTIISRMHHFPTGSGVISCAGRWTRNRANILLLCHLRESTYLSMDENVF